MPRARLAWAFFALSLGGWVSPSSGDIVWPAQGRPICTAPGTQDQITITSSANALIAILWRDARNNPANPTDIYGQVVGSDGTFYWAPGDTGRAVCRGANTQDEPAVGLDEQGRMWSAWTDNRTCTGANGQIFVQTLAPTGSSVCVLDGYRIGPNDCRQTDHARVVMLNATSSGVAWWRYVPGTEHHWYVRAQKTDMSCGAVWTANGVDAYHASSTDPDRVPEFYPSVISDGADGLIVAFQDEIVRVVLVSRVDFSGAVLWSGVRVCTTSSGTQGPSLVPPAIAPDGNGGAIVVWQHGSTGSRTIRGQRIDSNGVRQWGDCGKPIAEGPGDHHDPVIVRSTLGRSFVLWTTGTGGNENIYAQRINFLGDSLATRLAVCSEQFRQGLPQAVPGKNGSCIVAWEDERQIAIGDGGDVYAQQLEADGVILGRSNGVPVCSLATRQYGPRLAQNGFGGALVAWNDIRNGNTDIYATMLWYKFQIPDRTDAPDLGHRFDLTVVPNPFNPSATILYELPSAEMVNVRIYGVDGRLVRDLLRGERQTAGNHRLPWNGRTTAGQRLATGVYFVEIQAGQYFARERAVLIR